MPVTEPINSRQRYREPVFSDKAAMNPIERFPQPVCHSNDDDVDEKRAEAVSFLASYNVFIDEPPEHGIKNTADKLDMA